jgi:hypothetical protein
MSEKRTLIAALLAAAFVIATTATAQARPRPARHSSFSANKTFGLGVMLGAPSGISGKLFLSSDTALDFGLGVYHEFRHQDGLHAHMDFLWHPANLARTRAFYLPLYLGIGGRFFQHDHYYNEYNHGTHMGVRAPLGLAMDFNNVPLDIFFELAFVLDVVVDDNHDHADFGGAIGIRYYFE